MIYSNFIRSKIDNFQRKIFDIFLIFAQNIDCGYTFLFYYIKVGFKGGIRCLFYRYTMSLAGVPFQNEQVSVLYGALLYTTFSTFFVLTDFH